ncbi:uncharacterized protein YndB with AHSA1/START domain [Algoriphagus sp. 4150]|uniref:SRPBCC domain-containing protein n=1 Tax=Algoriphagus sp. 4150 TaxID=2817756 RepID=UPI00285BB61E|nr:SRPBCC domain-containing protein [Algoriphagus sp. 4150]MDR7132057.1 uncharacterized protein YndB with AHSA1/START domain [Algoriphagus sp. 4150]
MTNLETLHFEIEIACPPVKVHELMLAKETYKEWTHIFSPGSTFIGSWEEGSKIVFVGEGENEGMHGWVEKNDPGRFVSIEHLGEWKDGKEVAPNEATLNWVGAHENYTFEETDKGTLLKVDLDSPEDFSQHFAGIWPKALDKLKEICERNG